VNLPGAPASSIHTINLETGALGLLGFFRGSDRIVGFAVDLADARKNPNR
jgi:hypothetical protein